MGNFKQLFLRVAAVLMLLCNSGLVRSEVKLPAIFTDHMVLQRGEPVPVWGTAGPHEKITVLLGEHAVSALASQNGEWQVLLPAMDVGDPMDMKVSGRNTVVISDVLVGEVWFCSGQSNMSFRLRQAQNSEKDIANAGQTNMRLFNGIDHGSGSWQRCSPETAASFSAVGYYFGKYLQKELAGVPIGLIAVSMGGSSTEAWMSKESLAANPQANKVVELRLDRYKQIKSNYDEAVAEGLEAPIAPKKPKRFAPAGFELPENCWHRINSIAPYGIKGVLWYQGEANAHTVAMSLQQKELLPALISLWREKWNKEELPFLFVQLPNHKAPYADPYSWPAFRQSQQEVFDLVPNTGLIVSCDVGEMDNGHPPNKQPIGRRLALWALANVYKGQDLIFTGPRLKAMEVEGSEVFLSFTDTHHGLSWRDGKVSTGFELAGRDGIYHMAEPRILGNKLLLSSKEVDAPLSARYGWGDERHLTLMNQEGFPAWPFGESKEAHLSPEQGQELRKEWGPFVGPWERHDKNPVIGLDDKETYSIQNGPQSVIQWKDKWYMFLMTSQPMVTKLAVSDDGLTWHRPHHNYLLEPELEWEGSYNLAKAAVLRDDEIWLYYFGKKDKTEMVALARSKDLKKWQKEPAPIFTHEDSRIDGERAFPDCVIKEDDTWYMYYDVGFDYHHPKNPDGYAIGVATSTDGIQWTDSPKSPVLTTSERTANSWDDGMVSQCSVHKIDEWFYMIYSGSTNNYGRQHSGKNRMAFGLARARYPEGPWEKYPHNPVFKPTGNEKDFDGVFLQHPCPVKVGDQWRLYYNGWTKTIDAKNSIGAEYAIGVAFVNE